MIRRSGSGSPRAVGRRIGFPQSSPAFRAWLRDQFGTVTLVQEHVGGMSPGCASTIVGPDGHLFVKAVGAGMNAQTVELFRSEIRTLGRLDNVAYRPRLLAYYDDGDWVGLVLEHIPGRHPDLATDDDFTAVTRAVRDQIAELTPAPEGTDVLPLADTAQRWAVRWTALRDDPRRALPPWAAARFADLNDRVRELPSLLAGATLCHFDIRDDNLIVRGDGGAVILDWGMARLGPDWTDLVLLAAQAPTPEQAQRYLEHWIPADQQRAVTSLLIAFGGSQAWIAMQPARPGLPSLAAYCRNDSQRLLAIAQLRLDT